ncbi:hypothetical protein CRV24_008552 [Beauveria bassiana]|nr:hypothetical protein CRV24_008552 [Beauveria bassiana]KAH8716638.1 hypothetical protein HC256_005398 [Beauveria bassiana]
MQIVKSLLAIQALLLAPAALAVNIGERCDHNVAQEYTTCDNARTNIIYCDGHSSQWTWAYTCGGGCCYNAPASMGGESMANCRC